MSFPLVDEQTEFASHHYVSRLDNCLDRIPTFEEFDAASGPELAGLLLRQFRVAMECDRYADAFVMFARNELNKSFPDNEIAHFVKTESELYQDLPEPFPGKGFAEAFELLGLMRLEVGRLRALSETYYGEIQTKDADIKRLNESVDALRNENAWLKRQVEYGNNLNDDSLGSLL